MKQSLLYITMIFALLACSKKKKLPEDIIAQPKMQAIVWDLLRAGEFLNGYVLFRDTNVKAAEVSEKWFDKVYAIHQVTREQFNKSYEYYRTHPPVMRELLDSLAKKPAPAVANDPSIYHQSRTPDTAKKAPVIPGLNRKIIDSVRRVQVIQGAKRNRVDSLKRRKAVSPRIKRLIEQSK